MAEKTVISQVQGEDVFKITPLDVTPQVVNNVQHEDVYELPAAPVTRKPDPAVAPMTPVAEAVEAPPIAKVEGNIADHVTGHATNTTGGQLDIAIDLFILRRVDDFEKAKTELLNRIGLLETEAEQVVHEKIGKIKALFA